LATAIQAGWFMIERKGHVLKKTKKLRRQDSSTIRCEIKVSENKKVGGMLKRRRGRNRTKKSDAHDLEL